MSKSRKMEDYLLDALEVASYMKRDLMDTLIDGIQHFSNKKFTRETVSLGAAHILMQLASEVAYASHWNKEQFVGYAEKVWEAFEDAYGDLTNQPSVVPPISSISVGNKDGAN